MTTEPVRTLRRYERMRGRAILPMKIYLKEARLLAPGRGLSLLSPVPSPGRGEALGMHENAFALRQQCLSIDSLNVQTPSNDKLKCDHLIYFIRG